jgi:very-short-patch-repair endonuclease
VDFFCPERRLIVEVDGAGHGTFATGRSDSGRDAWLKEQDISVLRVSTSDVMMQLDRVCEAILAASSIYANPSPKPPEAVSALPQGEG